jgi:hypothetical protein
MIGGGQTLNLESGCFGQFTIAQHELLHALGMFHMQASPNRDNYVQVLWNNIDSQHHDQFDIVPWADLLGTQYDLYSIMHYTKYAFSINYGYYPVFALRPGVNFDLNNLGRSPNLTDGDVTRLWILYCNNRRDETQESNTKRIVQMREN